jgi:hypothetical protein
MLTGKMTITGISKHYWKHNTDELSGVNVMITIFVDFLRKKCVLLQTIVMIHLKNLHCIESKMPIFVKFFRLKYF